MRIFFFYALLLAVVALAFGVVDPTSARLP
jgi:hypothetical protein